MRIFISYRRSDHATQAELLRDALKKVMPGAHVFVDARDIAPGEHFPSRLDAELAKSDVVLALIGPNWVGSSQTSLREDWVSHELSQATSTSKVIFPVLVGTATLPDPRTLPTPYSRVLQYQVAHYRPGTSDSESDASRLASLMAPYEATVNRLYSRGRRAFGVGAILAAIAVGGVGWAFTAERPWSTRPLEGAPCGELSDGSFVGQDAFNVSLPARFTLLRVASKPTIASGECIRRGPETTWGGSLVGQNSVGVVVDGKFVPIKHYETDSRFRYIFRPTKQDAYEITVVSRESDNNGRLANSAADADAAPVALCGPGDELHVPDSLSAKEEAIRLEWASYCDLINRVQQLGSRCDVDATVASGKVCFHMRDCHYPDLQSTSDREDIRWSYTSCFVPTVYPTF